MKASGSILTFLFLVWDSLVLWFEGSWEDFRDVVESTKHKGKKQLTPFSYRPPPATLSLRRDTFAGRSINSQLTVYPFPVSHHLTPSFSLPLSVCLSVRLSVSLSVCLSASLSVCLSVSLFSVSLNPTITSHSYFDVKNNFFADIYFRSPNDFIRFLLIRHVKCFVIRECKSFGANQLEGYCSCYCSFLLT